MRHTTFIITLIFFVLNTLTSLPAKEISSLNDSGAFLSLAQFMMDSSEDLKDSYRISEVKLKINHSYTCEKISSVAVFLEVEKAITHILRLYPDEELPIEEAMDDLRHLLDSGSSFFNKCSIAHTLPDRSVNTAYFFDLSGKIHLRVDKIKILNWP